MRISTNQIFSSSVSAMQRDQFDLNQTQLQLSTGRRIVSSADDPSGAAQAVRLQAAISTTQQYQRNTDIAQPRLNLEETQVSAVENFMQRARELVLAAGSGTYNSSDHETTAKEIRQIHESILGIANSQDTNGEYLFAGNRSLDKPFLTQLDGSIAYVGSNSVRQVPISATRSIETGDTGQNVFMNVPDTGGQSIFGMLDSIATALESSDSLTSQEMADVTSTALLNIDSSLSQLSDVRTAVGLRLQVLDSQSIMNDERVVSLQSTLSEVRDLDYAEAISRFQLQDTVLQAAQQSYVQVSRLSLFNFL